MAVKHFRACEFDVSAFKRHLEAHVVAGGYSVYIQCVYYITEGDS